MTVLTAAQRTRQSFEAQFEADGDGRYLYRRNSKGEPIPVTAEERERFVSEYVRRMWLIRIATAVALCVVVGFVLPHSVRPSGVFSDPLFYGALVLIAVPSVAMMYWAGSAPAREL